MNSTINYTLTNFTEFNKTMNICNPADVDILILYNLDQNFVNQTNNTIGRFFFILYPQAFRCSDNWIKNPITILNLALIALFLVLFILFFCLEGKIRKNHVLLEYIRKEILKEKFLYYNEKQINEKYHYDRRIVVPKRQKKDNVFEIAKGALQNKTHVRNNLIFHLEDPDEINRDKQRQEYEDQEYKKKELKINKIKEKKLKGDFDENEIFGYDIDQELRELENIVTNKPNEDEGLHTANVGPIIVKFEEVKDTKRSDWDLEKEYIEPEPLDSSYFFIKNILMRHIYLSPFTRGSSFNPRHKRISTLTILLVLQIFCVTILYSVDSIASDVILY